LPAAWLALTRSRVALGRVREVLDAPVVGTPDRAEPAPDVLAADAGRVELAGLTVAWPGSEPVVARLHLTVSPGERVALVGPSGSGKTTIAATIMGLLPAMAGSVEVDGPIGYLAQDAYLFDTSVAENVRIGNRDATDAEIAAALAAARLDLPLDRLVGLHGTEVSGGEARRIALARLLVRPHPVLVLDEPTEHLDAPTATALLDDLWQLSDRAAVLVITHDRALAEACDRVITLARGKSAGQLVRIDAG
jgi:ABC-type transport system involved in cytochrome bd biosynthesis fused ATPase/permease subunit